MSELRIDTKYNLIKDAEYILIGNAGHKFNARIDTGAKTCSIDKNIVFVILNSKPNINDIEKVKSPSGVTRRKIIYLDISLDGIFFNCVKFNIIDRSKMTYQVLIGRNVLKHGFLVKCV